MVYDRMYRGHVHDGGSDTKRMNVQECLVEVTAERDQAREDVRRLCGALSLVLTALADLSAYSLPLASHAAAQTFLDVMERSYNIGVANSAHLSKIRSDYGILSVYEYDAILRQRQRSTGTSQGDVLRGQRDDS